MAEIICPQCKAANKNTAYYCSGCGASLLGLSPMPTEARTNEPGTGTGLLLQERYQIVKELGRGGFGAVYQAWDIRLDKTVAVKENLETSPEAQRQFAREALVLASLSHPNLPRVTDHFSLSEQGQYLVMDYVEGKDLETLAQTLGVVPVGQALTWTIQVAEALEYLHGQEPPVFHRDVKPANVRITPDGKAMLVDFGLVKVSAPQLKTTLGARAISPGYAPPEQYGQGRTDARTDIFGLSSTLYRMVTGREPIESVQRISGDTLLTAEQVNPAVPRQLSQAIERGMALDPINRFQSVKELKAALKELMTAALATDVERTIPVASSDTQDQTRPTIAVTGAPFVGKVAVDKTLSGLAQASGGAASSGSGIASGGVTTSISGHASGGVMPPADRMAGGASGGRTIPSQLRIIKAIPRWLIYSCAGGVSIFMVFVIAVSLIVMVSVKDIEKTEPKELQDTPAAQVEATSNPMVQPMQSTIGVISAATPQAPAVVAPVVGPGVVAATEGVGVELDMATQGAGAGLVMATPQEPIQKPDPVVVSFLDLIKVNATGALIYGPESGSFTHNPSNGSLEGRCTSLQIRDFMLQLMFSAPFSSSSGAWDLGIMFRMFDNGDLRVVIHHDKSWEFVDHKRDTEKYTIIEEGDIKKIGVNKGDTNLLQFVALDRAGWLYLNNTKVAKLDLASNIDSGTVCVGIGFYQDTEKAGEMTPYSDLSIWELR